MVGFGFGDAVIMELINDKGLPPESLKRGSVVGLSKWTADEVRHSLKGAWFQPFNLRSENLVSKFASKMQHVPLLRGRPRVPHVGGAAAGGDGDHRPPSRVGPLGGPGRTTQRGPGALSTNIWMMS